MSKVLLANNVDLLENAIKSYLSANYSSGVSSVVVINSNNIANEDYILLGNFGSETSEIIKVSTVTAATNTLSLASATKFAHSESTKITVLKYNQVKFYHTAAATFATGTLLSTSDIQADSFSTQYVDTSNTTGFGWYVFYNETTTDAADNSAAIPYAGYSENSAKAIMDRFYSLLNNKELKLITEDDAFSWLNEGYSIAVNHLNLVNKEFTASDEDDITLISGTSEYALDSTFSKMLSVYNGTSKIDVGSIKLQDITYYGSDTGNTLKYYLRGAYIGFVPTPSAAATITTRYTTKTSKLSSLYSNLELPNNNYYCLQDYMLFRAANKISRIDGESHLKLFYKSIDEMKINSIKSDNGLDSWSVAPECNV